MTRSTWHSGLILLGSPPSSFIAVRIAARSTTAGTPVKSYNRTRAGLNGISTSLGEVIFQLRIVSTSSAKSSFKSVIITFYVKVVAISDSALQKDSD